MFPSLRPFCLLNTLRGFPGLLRDYAYCGDSPITTTQPQKFENGLFLKMKGELEHQYISDSLNGVTSQMTLFLKLFALKNFASMPGQMEGFAKA
jgi:hypothetical protein